MQSVRRSIWCVSSPLQSTQAHGNPETPARLGGIYRFALMLPLFAALVFCIGCGVNPVHGIVSTTSNPQVALYTITTQSAAQFTVAFGPTTSYGLITSIASIPAGGATVGIYVAGMQANSIYHMRATVTFSDGRIVKDSDHVFQTSSYTAGWIPTATTETPTGQTPQPGIEVVNSIEKQLEIAAFDLSGHMIWAYDDPSLPLSPDSWLAPKLLPNGDFIAIIAPNSSTGLDPPPPAGTPNMVREFDLAGNTVKQITMVQLNAALAAGNYDLSLLFFSHDITVLPNGHWLVLANTAKSVVLNGQTTPTTVLGDVIVDLNENLQPVWVWNEFDHLDVNRHPWNFPDWTHTNAVIYSPDDGNLLVSIRHQNWIVKVDYDDGQGTGNVLWRLGAGGDFKLIGGTDPTDWSYAQHGISFTTQNTAGQFGLAVMDNGDDRAYPGDNPASLSTCGVNGAPACYSTVPIYAIDEANMTATLQFHQIQPSALYSFFGGNADLLKNGDVEYDLCGLAGMNSQVVEVTDEPNPQTVWTMKLPGNYVYRAYRIPSLYPGVQW